jgi:hypothetical protein
MDINVIAAPNRVGEELFQLMRTLFSDFYKSGVNYFDELASEKLRRMIFEEFNTPEGKNKLLTKEIVQRIFDRYYDKRQYKSADTAIQKQLKWRMEMLNLIFKSCLVLLAAQQPDYIRDNEIQLVPDVKSMIELYPELGTELDEQVDKKELGYLLTFLNYARIAMPIIPANSNKHLLLKILERLEGSNNHYVTGGGSKPSTNRRMHLIEMEGKNPKVPRMNRKKNRDGFVENNETRKNKMMKNDSGVPQKPSLSRDSSCKISVDFDCNTVPVDQSALPPLSTDNEQSSILWNLIEAVDINNSSIRSNDVPSNGNGKKTAISLTGIKTPAKPSFVRTHSLFNPDLQT